MITEKPDIGASLIGLAVSIGRLQAEIYGPPVDVAGTDQRYQRVTCATCGDSYQRIDYRCARHTSFCAVDPNPKPAVRETRAIARELVAIHRATEGVARELYRANLCDLAPEVHLRCRAIAVAAIRPFLTHITPDGPTWAPSLFGDGR